MYRIGFRPRMYIWEEIGNSCESYQGTQFDVIQPHPNLIDLTAKPRNLDTDDSDLGRYNYSSRYSEYEKSIVVDEWKKARKGREVDLEENAPFFPDETSEMTMMTRITSWVSLSARGSNVKALILATTWCLWTRCWQRITLHVHSWLVWEKTTPSKVE